MPQTKRVQARPVDDDWDQLNPMSDDYQNMLAAQEHRLRVWDAAITGHVSATQFDSFKYGFEMGWRMARGDKALYPESTYS